MTGRRATRRLRRPNRPEAASSLVSMIDVLMIMLVFFMVTSTFLDLDMLPLAATDDSPAAPAVAPEAKALLIRIAADGSLRLGARTLDAAALAQTLRDQNAGTSGLRVSVLPSAQAPVQALAVVMDAAAAVGIGRLAILQPDLMP